MSGEMEVNRGSGCVEAEKRSFILGDLHGTKSAGLKEGHSLEERFVWPLGSRSFALYVLHVYSLFFLVLRKVGPL
jgi:hypothetical protein